MVDIPYCTGDLHSGDAVVAYSTGTLTISAHHRGFRNMTKDLAVLKTLFPKPSRVAVWGISAGALGTACNMSQYVGTWPGTPLSTMQNGFSTFSSSLLPQSPSIFEKWGLWSPGADGSIVAKTCPIATPPGPAHGYDYSYVDYYNLINNRNVRKAWSDDYADWAFDGGYCYAGVPADSSGSCAYAVAAIMNSELSMIGDDPSYRVYFHNGICHGEREYDYGELTSDCDYDNMVQPPKAKQLYDEDCKADGTQTCFRDWVHQWIEGSSDWVNVK
jgi:hypothetical protein